MKTVELDFGNAFKYDQKVKSNISTVIAGIGMYAPEKIVSNQEIEEMTGFEKFDIQSGLIDMLTGVKQRHYAAAGQQSSDLAAFAAKDALENSGLHAMDIDLIIFAAVCQDVAEPASAYMVQDKIGAYNAQAMDIKNACNAFMNSIDMADSYIKSGKAENVLVVSGEILSRYIRHTFESAEELKKRIITLSVGDAGAAMVLTGVKDTERGIRSTFFHAWGNLWQENVLWGGGTAYPRTPEKFYIPGDTKRIIGHGLLNTVPFVKKSFDSVGWDSEAIDFVALHQFAKIACNTFCKELNIPIEKTVINLDKYGNTGSCSIPIVLKEAEKNGKLSKDNKVCLFGGSVGYSLGVINLVR